MKFYDNVKERKEERDKESRIKSMGRSKIDDTKRLRYSRRAIQGRLNVIKADCPFCHHHKALQNTMHTKCARCKRLIE